MTRTSDTSAAGSVPGYRQEQSVEPEPAECATSDRELDRLAPLATSLHHWSPVYERWRLHESAAVRPEEPRFDRADLSAIDNLRSVHFGHLAAASRRLRHVGAALDRIVESTAEARSALVEAWRDTTSQRAVLRFDHLRRGAQDCAARCERLGLHLESAIVDTVAPVIKSAVDEILAGSRQWERAAGRTAREVWEQRIAELDAGRMAGAGPWHAELDALVVDYDAVIGVYRATLAAAEATIAQVYQALHREIGSLGENPFGSEPGVAAVGPEPPAGTGTSGGADRESESAPASTALACAGPAGADGPAAGSSSASGGGGSPAVAAGPGAGGSALLGGAGGSALLGELSEPPPVGSGGATLASASDDPGYGAGAATAGAGGAGFAPIAGVLGSAAAEDQHRTARPWAVAADGDQEQAASWERLRALLGDDAGARPERGRAGR